MLVVVSVAHIVLALLVERLALQIWALPIDVYFLVHAGVTALGLLVSGAIVLLLLRPDAARFVDPLRPAPVAAAADVSRHAYDVARIRAAFESERVYRRMGLTVGALAEHLKIPEYRLRSLIHGDRRVRLADRRHHGARVGVRRAGHDVHRRQPARGRDRDPPRARFHALPVVVSVLVEAAVLALAGGILGAAVAYAVRDGYTASTLNPAAGSQLAFAFQVTPASIRLGLGWAIALGVVGGTAPAMRAARLPMTTVLRGT